MVTSVSWRCHSPPTLRAGPRGGHTGQRASIHFLRLRRGGGGAGRRRAVLSGALRLPLHTLRCAPRRWERVKLCTVVYGLERYNSESLNPRPYTPNTITVNPETLNPRPLFLDP